MTKHYNELNITYKHGDGRTFRLERGKATIDLGYESHGMFVMKLKYDWGAYCYNSILLDDKDEFDIPEDKKYMGDLIKAVLKVFGTDYLSTIKDLETYIIFNDKRDPVGFVNIKDSQNYIIFDDFFKLYTK